jgi:hypothetical protein
MEIITAINTKLSSFFSGFESDFLRAKENSGNAKGELEIFFGT